MFSSQPSGKGVVMKKASLLFLISIFFLGCQDSEPSDADADADVDADGDIDADQDIETDSDADQPLDPRFESLAETLEAERIALGAPGLAFALIENNEIAFTAGFGHRHPDSDEDPVDSTTLFRIGSVTKVLTALALLQLVEAGEISLDDPVTDVFPDFAFALDETWVPSILVRHILEHSSGMFDYGEFGTDADEYLEKRMYYYADNYYLMSPSGRMFNYSNPNFSLAGWLIEGLSKRSYREYVDSEVFSPLGMDRTYFLGQEVLEDGNYASGLTINWSTGIGRAVAEPDSYGSAFMRPAGFAWSSVEDLAELVLFLLNGNTEVLSDELLDEVRSPQISTKMSLDYGSYGFGLFINDGFAVGEDYYETTVISHGGDISGFAADVYFLPELEFGLIALANTDGAHIQQAVAEALLMTEGLPDGLPEPTSPPDDLTIDPGIFDEYTGYYHDPYIFGNATVTYDSGTLSVSIPYCDQEGIPYEPALYPLSPDNFFLNIQNTSIVLTFIRDAEGHVEYARTRTAVFSAVDEPVPPPPVMNPQRHHRLRYLLEQARLFPALFSRFSLSW